MLRVRKPTPALVISMLALFVALGSSSLAAPVRDAAKKLISGKQIKDSSLTTKDIKNRSLLKADFKAGQLPAGAKGDAGPKGDKGDKGNDGNQGPAGPTAAAKASKNFAPDVLLGPSSDTNVIDLDTTFAGASRLHLTFSGRVMADAIVNVYNQTASAQTIDCNLALMNPTNTGQSDSGPHEWQTLTAGANTYESMPVKGAFDLAPGDYNFRVICSQIGGNANDTAVDDATLTVIAAAN
jgi:hypothetical protein